MPTEKEILIARLIFVPFASIFIFSLFTQVGKSLNDLFYALTENTDYHIFLKFDTREKVVFGFSVSWIILQIAFEFIAYFSKNFRLKFRRLLTNLRYAPIAVLIFSGFAVAVYDAAMIAYSKHQIRNYIFNSSQSVAEPDFPLFNNYRHWCGNGASAWENYLYFETAAEGINDENPYVRARSLLMSAEVQDWINGGDERFDNFLAKSCTDSNQIVKTTAEKYLNDWHSGCQKYLLSK